MALYIFDKYYCWQEVVRPKNNSRRIRYYSQIHEVQAEYCTLIDEEISYGKPFFNHESVREYLKMNKITYCGQGMLEFEEWDNKKRFATFLNWRYQVACIMLSNPQDVHVITNFFLFSVESLRPVIEKMDIYLILDNLDDFWFEDDLVERRVQLYINGVNVNEMSEDEAEEYYSKIEVECSQLDRESDRKYFQENFISAKVIPYETNLYDYLEDVALPSEKRDLIKNREKVRQSLLDVKVFVNGKNRFQQLHLVYPLYILYEIEGQWRYKRDCTYKEQSFGEILNEVFFPETWGCREQENYKMEMTADRIFLMVINEYGGYNVKQYWNYIAFLAKFERKAQTIEICEHMSGVKEFHEIWQRAEDL